MSVVSKMPTTEELQLLDNQVVDALASGDLEALKVVGFGEISLALGWPADAPQFVCKRTPPATHAQLSAYSDLVAKYIDALSAQGIACVETSTVTVQRDGLDIGYLVQPLQASETLGDNVLRASEPSPGHPFLLAICDVINKVTPQLSVDSQFTNWTWDGTEARLLDVGSPFLWDKEGRFEMEISPFMVMFPWPIRPLVHKEMVAIASKWQKPRAVAVDVAASLYRVDLEQWMDSVLEAFNLRVVPDDPITASDARAAYDEDVKTWPRLKQMQQVQRAWQTRVRRQDYEFFIQNSYTGEII